MLCSELNGKNCRGRGRRRTVVPAPKPWGVGRVLLQVRNTGDCHSPFLHKTGLLELGCGRSGDHHAGTVRQDPTSIAAAMIAMVLLLALTRVAQGAPDPAGTPPWVAHGPLCVSPDGHSLQHADGTPFFWLGDTAWALHQNLSRQDVNRYLDDSAAVGFTVIQLMSVNAWALKDWKNFYGDAPYLDGKAWKLNTPYWRHVGWVIDAAAKRGMYVLLVYGSPGRLDNHGPVTRTPAQAYAYGHALGAFFRDKPNLIWSGGIDMDPDDPKRASPMGLEGWAAMAEGIADGVCGVDRFDGRADWSKTLVTYHPRGFSTSSKWFQAAAWLDFNGAQVGWKGDRLIRMIRRDCRRRPPKPVVNLEPWYEGATWKKPPMSDWDVRLEAYQSFFAGAAGFTYGHFYIYQFDSPGEPGGFEWRKHLRAPGRLQMRCLRTLMTSKPLSGRRPLPDLVIESPGGARRSQVLTKHVAALGAVDGSWAFVYSPAGAPFTVQLSKLRGSAIAVEWFDPRTGGLADAGSVSRTAGARRFDPPGPRGPGRDAVLILTSR